MARTAVFVGGDLMARARLQEACDAFDISLESIAPDDLRERVSSGGIDLLILDLDSGGHALLDDLADIPSESGLEVVGFFSHIDEELGRAAAERGCRALPRGRFWRSLTEILSPDPR